MSIFNADFPFVEWARDNLVGTWVGSFSGFIHNHPRHRRSDELPQLGAFTDRSSTAAGDSGQPPKLSPTNGFYPFAGMMAVKFDNHGTLVGEFSTNMSGLLRDEPLTGSYEWGYNEVLEVPAGTFSLKFSQSQGNNAEVTQLFRLTVRGSEEIHFLSQSATRLDPGSTVPIAHRPTIAHGVLYRTRFEH